MDSGQTNMLDAECVMLCTLARARWARVWAVEWMWTGFGLLASRPVFTFMFLSPAAVSLASASRLQSYVRIPPCAIYAVFLCCGDTCALRPQASTRQLASCPRPQLTTSHLTVSTPSGRCRASLSCTSSSAATTVRSNMGHFVTRA